MHWNVLEWAVAEEVVRNSHKVGVHLEGKGEEKYEEVEEGQARRRWITSPYVTNAGWKNTLDYVLRSCN